MAANIVDDAPSFGTILSNFGLSDRAKARLVEDYPDIQSLMDSSSTDLKNVIYNQNKTFRTHSTAAQRCYITATQQSRIMAFHKWATYAIRDAGSTYTVADLPMFTRNWVDAFKEEYNAAEPETTPESTAFAVSVPKFSGTNWFDVRMKIHDLLSTRIGSAGLPLTYLIRETRDTWDATVNAQSLQHRRIATKAYDGPSFDRDNREFHRILTNLFSGSTLENIVQSNQSKANGVNTWNQITANVQGANYTSDLKRQADRIISAAFFDPDKMFSFDQYFDRHVLAHSMFLQAQAPVAEWKKIEDFMKGVRCTALQNDYRQIKDLPQYATFTAFYNKINENYRTLVDQKILKPASILKRKISQVDTNSEQRNTYRGGRGTGRSGGRGRSQGRGRGRGRGRSGRGNNQMSSVTISSLPNNIDINGPLSFTDDEWYKFSAQERAAIQSLRRQKQQYRQSQTHNQSQQQSNRQIAAISAETQSVTSELTVPQQQSNVQFEDEKTPSVTQSSQAGRAFGKR